MTGVETARALPQSASHAYRIATLKLVSDIDLPELPPWGGPPDAPAQLRFRLGKVPAALGASNAAADQCAAGRRNRYLIDYGDRMLVENGSTVTVQLAPGTDLAEARAMLMGPAQAVLWHQRGLLPMHASAVDIAGKAVVLAGPSGIGKSTLASALSGQGAAIMADDISIIDPEPQPSVQAGAMRLRLLPDALRHLGLSAAGRARAPTRREKYLFDGSGARSPARQTLAAIFMLRRQKGGPVALERLQGARSIVELWQGLHLTAAARQMGREPDVVRALTRLPAAGVSVWRLTLPENPTCLEAAAARVLEAVND